MAVRIIIVALTLLVGVLSGCGGSQDQVPIAKESLLAERVVVVNDVPNLLLCLGQLSAVLQKNPGDTDVSLSCAAGTYRGMTSEGRECELKVDSDKGVFRLQVEREAVSINWGNVAHTMEGRPMHNLEDASAPSQRGIQLTRFTGSLVPVTEALILRVGTAGLKLPQMIYQRTADGATKSVVCNFGK
jgi:hypothetical protein